MGRKTISIDEETYELLSEHKREEERFSDVIKRLSGERSWKSVAGIWDDDTTDLRAAIEEGRERSRKHRRDR